jgi:hypothetical protein
MVLKSGQMKKLRLNFIASECAEHSKALRAEWPSYRPFLGQIPLGPNICQAALRVS